MPVHAVRAERGAARGRDPGPAARGRGQAAVGRGRLHQRAALLQAAQQHGPARGAHLVGERAAARRGRVPERDALRLAGGPARLAGRRSRATPHTSSPTTRRTGTSLQSGRARPRHPPRAAARPRFVRGRRQRGLQVRRQRVPDRQLERDELLGRRRLHAHAAFRHAAAGDHARSLRPTARRGVALSAQATVTFDEPMQASTITPSTFMLRDGAGNPVAAAITLRRADAQGDAAARSRRSSTARPTRSRCAAARAVSPTAAGNPLAADRSWSFSTPAACPCTVFDPGRGPAERILVRRSARGRHEVPCR